MQFIKAAPFRLGAKPVMVFGMGSYSHPASRSSVGFFLVGLLGKRLGLDFHRFTHCNAYVAHYGPENLLLVQPDTYFVSQNHQCLRRIVNHYPVDPAKSVLIYHEPTLPLGAVHYMTKGRTEGNADLHALASELKTEEFPRIAVGVQYPDPTMRFSPPVLHQMQSIKPNYAEYFLLNKFPKSHWVQLHEFVVPRLFAAVDKAVGEIRATYPLTSIDEENSVRAESHFGTDIMNAQEVLTGPRVPAKEGLTADELEARLWEVRRQREDDPEFKRLIATSGTSAPRR